MNEPIIFEDFTKYSFRQDNGKVSLIAHKMSKHEGPDTLELPYNCGKFDGGDYDRSPKGPGYFWDWYKISRKERKAFKQFMQTHQQPLSISDYRKMKSIRNQYCTDLNCGGCDLIQLAPLPKAVPCTTTGSDVFKIPDLRGCQQEGKTPMRYNDNYASASANVSARPSDSEVSRDYLTGRLRDADYPKQTQLAVLFNLYKDNTPKTYKEMIDIIKAGTYTIDAKIAKRIEANLEDDDLDDCMGTVPLWGIIWPGPVSDHAGYALAVTEKNKQKKIAQDVIMTSDAAAGLAAVYAFEAWLPTTATATAQ